MTTVDESGAEPGIVSAAAAGGRPRRWHTAPAVARATVAFPVLAVGAVATVGGVGYGRGSLADPGPGMWPFVVGVVVIATGLAMLVSPIRRTEEPEGITATGLAKVALAAAAMYVFYLLFTWAGLILPSLLFLLVWLRFLAGLGWVRAAVAAVVGAAATYAVFVAVLELPLPVADLLTGRS